MFGRWFNKGKPAKAHGDPLQPHGASVEREEPTSVGQSTAPHGEEAPAEQREQPPQSQQ